MQKPRKVKLQIEGEKSGKKENDRKKQHLKAIMETRPKPRR